ncbi:hypothetical protein RQP46_007429 [Phenoliferia psychrophenolica]
MLPFKAAAFLAVSFLLPQISSCALLPILPSNQTVLTLAPGAVTRYVALGRGVQNYTCTAGAWTSAGAVAKLYDISSLPESCFPSLTAIPTSALTTTFSGAPARLPSGPAPGNPSAIKSAIVKAFLGNHFFVSVNGTLTPEFHFTGIKGPGQFVLAKVTGRLPSPNSPTVNVPWLQLAKQSGDLASTVYRLNTAGGQPPTSCTTAGSSLSVQYAAIYWFMA